LEQPVFFLSRSQNPEPKPAKSSLVVGGGL
jgi:hypothetical protein